MTYTLDQRAVNQLSRIAMISGDDVMVERLLEMGFVPGEEVLILQKMLFSGPLIVEVRSTAVALRIEEAQCIQILA